MGEVSLSLRAGRVEGGCQVGSTGHKCEQSGIYQFNCSDVLQIALSKGDTFPPCGKHGAVTWNLITATVN